MNLRGHWYVHALTMRFTTSPPFTAQRHLPFQRPVKLHRQCKGAPPSAARGQTRTRENWLDYLTYFLIDRGVLTPLQSRTAPTPTQQQYMRWLCKTRIQLHHNSTDAHGLPGVARTIAIRNKFRPKRLQKYKFTDPPMPIKDLQQEYMISNIVDPRSTTNRYFPSFSYAISCQNPAGDIIVSKVIIFPRAVQY